MVDYYAIISLLIRTLSIGIILFYVIPKQFMEVLRPKDWLTRLRWQILLLFLFTVFASIPALTYQAGRVNGETNESFRNIVSISSNLSILSTSILLVLIYNYKSPSIGQEGPEKKDKTNKGKK